MCQQPTGVRGVCSQCLVPFERAWCVGFRTDSLERLIDLYKFSRAIQAATVLSELLDTRLPTLPNTTVIIPIPTIRKHIRQRGYDHTLLVARKLAHLRSLTVQSHLERRSQTVQRDATKATRIAQAKEAFVTHQRLDPDTPYLILDDVVTTGATITYATKVLRDAGARRVWVAAISRQPLDR